MSARPLRRAFAREPASPDGRFVLDPEESHHLCRVLRVGVGDSIAVFDGSGEEWEARVEEAGKERVVAARGARVPGEVEPRVRVTLAQGLIRPEKLEWVLEKGTEVGISAFRIVPSRRATAPPPSGARLARYARILLEACKQSGRRVVPELTVGDLGPPPGGAGILLDPGANAPIAAALAVPRAQLALAVGPEGGFEDDEVDLGRTLGWRGASLGPRVLRTETAGLVAAALVLHAWGDLGGPGRI